MPYRDIFGTIHHVKKGMKYPDFAVWVSGKGYEYYRYTRTGRTVHIKLKNVHPSAYAREIKN